MITVMVLLRGPPSWTRDRFHRWWLDEHVPYAKAQDVIASVTSRAAAAIGKSAELGSLAPGMIGDAVVLELEDGQFTYVDGARNEVKAERRFRTRHVIRGGRRLPAAHTDLL